jgi:hypothetical protein
MKVVLTLSNDLEKTYENAQVEEDPSNNRLYILRGKKYIAGYWLEDVRWWELVEDELST